MDTEIIAAVEDVLAEYLSLQAEIKAKSKRMDEIRRWCKEQGSFATPNFVCSINMQTRRCLLGLDAVIEAVGMELLENYNLIQTVTFPLVHVSKKTTT